MTSGYSLVAKNGSRNGLIYAPEETPKIQFVVHHTAGLGGAKATNSTDIVLFCKYSLPFLELPI